MQIRCYRGVGKLGVQTPRGEVYAHSGDFIVEHETGEVTLLPASVAKDFLSAEQMESVNPPATMSIADEQKLASDSLDVDHDGEIMFQHPRKLGIIKSIDDDEVEEPAVLGAGLGAVDPVPTVDSGAASQDEKKLASDKLPTSEVPNQGMPKGL